MADRQNKDCFQIRFQKDIFLFASWLDTETQHNMREQGLL